MSTNSTIGIYNAKTKRTKSIYCHWDGYLSYNGKMLLKHYSRREKVNKMISLGNMSSLQERNRPPGLGKQTFHPCEDGKHFKNVSTFYCDRGEDKPAQNGMISQRYQYLYIRGEWYGKVRYASNDHPEINESEIVYIGYTKYIKLKTLLKTAGYYGFPTVKY